MAVVLGVRQRGMRGAAGAAFNGGTLRMLDAGRANPRALVWFKS